MVADGGVSLCVLGAELLGLALRMQARMGHAAAGPGVTLTIAALQTAASRRYSAPRCRDSVEGSEADLLLGGSPRSDRTFMSTRDKVCGVAECVGWLSVWGWVDMGAGRRCSAAYVCCGARLYGWGGVPHCCILDSELCGTDCSS